MKLNRSRPTVRRPAVWAVPVLTIGAVVGGGVLISTASASPHPRLPSRTAAQLLAAVQTTSATDMSGTIVETARFGLPSLPGADGGASLSWQSLITGSHTARVWIAGPDKQRVALLGPLSESDVIHNGTDLWTYASDTNQVTHTVLSAKDSHGERESRETPNARSYTPAAAAQQALNAIDPTTHVSVDPTRVVAGQKAYTLVLTPRDTRSTVRKVTIAIDSRHFVPLQVQVFGSGWKPAFQTGFSGSVSFATPKASIFTFHVPAGASVASDPLMVHRDRGRHDRPESQGSSPQRPSRPAKPAAPTVIGTGWTSIAELSAGLPGGAQNALLDKLTTPVGTTGDKILTTTLLNVLILKDGRVFLGAVSPSMLEQTAAATPR